jgi:hypothetical protein
LTVTGCMHMHPIVMDAADALMVAVSAVMVGVLALGAAGGAGRRGQPPGDARRVGRTVALVLGAWLALSAALAAGGLLAAPSGPPRWPLLPITAFAAIALVTRSAAAGRVLSHVPHAWPIAAQTFRVGVELALFALHTEGRAPVQIMFEGRNFDVLVGVSAPVIAWLVARGRIGAKGALVWNALGLAVLANTVVTIATSTPGPLHHDWPGAPLTAIMAWPIVWLPAFLMPAALMPHVVSVRQSLLSLKAAPVVRPTWESP